MKAVHLLLLSLIATSTLCSFTCSACSTVVHGLASTISFIIPNFVAVQGLEILCLRKYDSQKLCKKVGKQIAPLAISNFIQNHVNPDKKCSFTCNHSFVHYNPQKQVQRILEGIPLPPINLSPYLEKEQFQIQPTKTLKILHISDIHQDQNYVQKSSINCEYPICCHQQNGFPQNINAQAQPYGSKNCDSPPKLLDSFLDYITEQQDINIIVGTGDFSAHNQWQKTPQTIIEIQQKITQKINLKFPNAPFIKVDGNNDYIPDHQYNPKTIPKLIKYSTVNIGKITHTFVGLNTIVYDDFNLYLLGDQSYAIFQLMLLQQILELQENVYIYGHIAPTTTGAATEYSTVFRALIAKYSSKIKGQFYGHTHADQLSINTYPTTEHVTGFGFICPSMSPWYVGMSRSRVYKVSIGQHNGVNDYTQYIFKNLSERYPTWNREYQFRQRYHLPQSDLPITNEQIAEIKKNIIEIKSEQIKYLRTMGLDQQYQSKSYCLIIDEISARKACFNRSAQLNDRLYAILDLLRGKWGYHKYLVQ